MASRSLGTLTLDLVVKMAGFVDGMDKAERITAKRAKEMQAHMKAFTVAMGVGLEHAFEGGIELLGDVVKATIEAEKSQAQLAQAFKTSGGASGQSLKSLRSIAEELQKITGVDDDAIASVETLLLQFRHISGDTFPQATKAVLDFSARMGVDLPTAAVAVGKALENPVNGLKALKAAGVDLSDSQQKTIQKLVETGHAAEAQKIVLDELTKSVGGAAEAARNTLGGALAALKVSTENLLEGDTTGGGMKGLVDSVNGLNDTINDPSIKSGIQDLIQGMAHLAEFAVKGASAFGGLAEAINQAFTADEQKNYDGLLHRLYQIDSAIGDIKKHGISMWEPLGTSLKDLEAERAQVEKSLDQMRGVQSGHFDTGASATRGHGGANGPLNQIRVTAGDAAAGTGHTTASGHNAAADAARRQAEAEKDLHQQLEQLAKATDDINSILQDQAREMGGPLVDAGIAYRDTMTKILESEDELRQHGELTAGAEAAIAQARDQATASYQKQIDAIQSTKSPLQELLDQQQHELDTLGLTGAALETANELWGQSAEDIAKYGDAIRANNQALEDSRQAIADHAALLDEERSTFSDFFQDFAKNGMSALDRLVQHIEDIILKQLGDQLAKSLFPDSSGSGGSAGGWLGSLFSSFSSSGGGSAAAIGDYPTYGFGGITPPPGFAEGTNYAPGGWAIVGERGRELVNLPRGSQVIPNHQLGGMGAPGKQIVVNQTIAFQGRLDNRSAAQIARATYEEGLRAYRRTR